MASGPENAEKHVNGCPMAKIYILQNCNRRGLSMTPSDCFDNNSHIQRFHQDLPTIVSINIGFTLFYFLHLLSA